MFATPKGRLDTYCMFNIGVSNEATSYYCTVQMNVTFSSGSYCSVKMNVTFSSGSYCTVQMNVRFSSGSYCTVNMNVTSVLVLIVQ